MAVRSIPEDGQKPTPCTLFPLEIVAKLNDVILKSVQLRISGANYSYVGELALLGRIRDHFCFPAVPAAQLRVSACRRNFSGGERQPQHSNCCAAAWSGHRIPAPAYGFLAQLLQDSNTHRGQLKGLPNTFMEHLAHPCNLGSKHILHIRKDYSAQHMWWYELGVPSQSNGPSHQLASKSPGFVTLAQSPRRLLCGEPVQ